MTLCSFLRVNCGTLGLLGRDISEVWWLRYSVACKNFLPTKIALPLTCILDPTGNSLAEILAPIGSA